MVSLEYISVPSPNGARPIYRSADCVISPRGWVGFDDRPRAGRSRSGSRPHPDDVGDEWRIVSPSTRGNLSRGNKSKCRVGKSFGNGSLYPPVSFGVVERMDSEFEDYTERDCCGARYRVTRRRKDGSGRHVNSIEEEDSPFAIIRSSTDRLWD